MKTTSIKNFGKKLNAAQLKAVQASISGVHVLNASAGCGKSLVVCAAASYINNITDGNCSILVLSFTKRTTADLMQRMANIHANITISTIHGFVYKCLRGYGYKSFTFIKNEAEVKNIIKKILTENGLDEKLAIEDITTAISKDIYPTAEIKNIVLQTLDTLKSMRKFTYDSILYEAYDLFSQRPSVARRISQYFSHVFVDESNDISSIQSKIIKELWPNDGDNNLFFAGDPLQSIYSWRGSMPNVMQHLTEYYKAEVHKLTLNYRCASHSILDFANSVMPEAGLRPTLADNGCIVTYHTADDQAKEAEYVLERIRALRSLGTNWSDIVILFRSTPAVEAVYNALAASDIPFVRYGGQQRNIWTSSMSKRVIGIVALLNEKNNHHYIHCVMPVFGIDPDISREIHYTNNKTLVECILDVPSVSRKAKKNLKEFLATDISKLNLREQIILLWDKYLKEFFKAEDDELLDYVLTQTANMDTYADLRKYLSDCRKQQKKQERIIANNIPHVSLMTPYCAKGLEFKHVFVVGLQDGLWPDTSHETNIEEEKRLLFVAITRACESLTLSYPARNDKSQNIPCRFIKDRF